MSANLALTIAIVLVVVFLYVGIVSLCQAAARGDRLVELIRNSRALERAPRVHFAIESGTDIVCGAPLERGERTTGLPFHVTCPSCLTHERYRTFVVRLHLDPEGRDNCGCSICRTLLHPRLDRYDVAEIWDPDRRPV